MSNLSEEQLTTLLFYYSRVLHVSLPLVLCKLIHSFHYNVITFDSKFIHPSIKVFESEQRVYTKGAGTDFHATRLKYPLVNNSITKMKFTYDWKPYKHYFIGVCNNLETLEGFDDTFKGQSQKHKASYGIFDSGQRLDGPKDKIPIKKWKVPEIPEHNKPFSIVMKIDLKSKIHSLYYFKCEGVKRPKCVNKNYPIVLPKNSNIINWFVVFTIPEYGGCTLSYA